jgi:hypothetical protein
MNGSDRQFFIRKVPWFWVAGTLVLVAAAGIWGGVTQPPPYRWIGVGFAAILVALGLRVILLPRSRMEGTVLVQCGFLGTRRADLARAVHVRLRPTAIGDLQLVARDDTGGSAVESVLSITQYVTVAQPPELLDRIAQALASASDSRAAGIRKVLGMQADHLRRGGKAEDSPLRPLTNRSLMGTAEAASVLSILGPLD